MKSSYSDLVERLLLRANTLDRLFPTEPREPETVRRIREAADDDIAGGRTVREPGFFPLIRALLFYRFDALEEAHWIVQNDSSGPGSYLHGMIHRREGDLDNARYWFRRTGRLGFFPELHREASCLCADVARQPDWDPYLFVGLVEQARHGDGDRIAPCVAIQRAEFDVFLADVWRRTFGT